MKATEDFLSAEVSKLSVQERSKALIEDYLHCVGEELQESPELIRESLEEFDQYFNKSLGQLKPERFIRAHYYMMLHILTPPIPTVQIKGLVMVYYYDISKSDQKFSIPPISAMLTTVKDYRRSVPVRYTALHMLIFQQYVDDNHVANATQIRTRSHYGSHMEIQYSRRSYGVPQDRSFPMESGGNFRSEIGGDAWFQKHISAKEKSKGSVDDRYVDATNAQLLAAIDVQEDSMAEEKDELAQNARTVQESSTPDDKKKIAAVAPEQNDRTITDESPTIQPAQQDVLLGKGGQLQEHIGNIRFREFVEGFQDHYDQAPRYKRRKVSTEVVQALRGKGIRFLQRSEEGNWGVESDSRQADEGKVIGQLFRSRRKFQQNKS